MGCVFNRGTSDRPNIWIRYREVDGRMKRVPVGHINPDGKTKREVADEERDLRKLGRRMLHQAELNVIAGRAGFVEEPAPEPLPLFETEGMKWGKARKADNHRRSGGHNLQHMRKHLVPAFKGLRLDEITTGQVLRLVDRLRPILSPSTIQRVLVTLSRFINDMRERDYPQLINPVAALDRATRRRLKPVYDPEVTPDLKTKADIRRVYLALPDHMRPVFAVGAFAGLRKAEILALRWSDVDLERRRIKVERQKVHGKDETGPLKNNKSRVAPINDSLLAVLKEWKLRGAHAVLCFPSRIGTMLDDHTPNMHLEEAFGALEALERLTWYQATRHTFASHWVMDGRPIEKLKAILGHCSVTVTERYAHLRPDAFGTDDYRAACVDLAPSKVLPLRRRRGSRKAIGGVDTSVDTPCDSGRAMEASS